MTISYAACRSQIADGDLLLWRPTSLLGWRIALNTRGEYSHAAMACRWRGVLMMLDMVFSGGRAVTLSSQVRKYPGRIDWYSADHSSLCWDRSKTVRGMIRRSGERYGWVALWKNALSYIPFVRWFMRPDWSDDTEAGDQALCSQAVAAAYRRGGIDVTPGLADEWTTPTHLSQSRFFTYRGSLVP